MDATLIRPLAAYGAAQIAGLTPATLNGQLDQLVLSQAVPAGDLARYWIAVPLMLLSTPFVSSICNVAFPRLAPQDRPAAATHRMQRMAVLGSAGIAAAMLVPLAAGAYWIVPPVFGAGYPGAVPLPWILSPGAVFLACGQITGDLHRGRNRPIFVAWAHWKPISGLFKLALAVETGAVRGHVVTQNLTFVATKPRPGALASARGSRSLPGTCTRASRPHSVRAGLSFSTVHVLGEGSHCGYRTCSAMPVRHEGECRLRFLTYPRLAEFRQFL